MKHFTQWLVIFSVSLLGTFSIIYSGLAVKIYQCDITKLTFAIWLLFILYSISIGKMLYQRANRYTLNKLHTKKYNKILTRSENLRSLGFIGTIIGFIYMLNSFSVANFADAASTQKMLANVTIGMGTALFTTAAGLICSLILNWQLELLKKYINDESSGS